MWFNSKIFLSEKILRILKNSKKGKIKLSIQNKIKNYLININVINLVGDNVIFKKGLSNFKAQTFKFWKVPKMLKLLIYEN